MQRRNDVLHYLRYNKKITVQASIQERKLKNTEKKPLKATIQKNSNCCLQSCYIYVKTHPETQKTAIIEAQKKNKKRQLSRQLFK